MFKTVNSIKRWCPLESSWNFPHNIIGPCSPFSRPRYRLGDDVIAFESKVSVFHQWPRFQKTLFTMIIKRNCVSLSGRHLQITSELGRVFFLLITKVCNSVISFCTLLNPSSPERPLCCRPLSNAHRLVDGPAPILVWYFWYRPY